MNGPGIIAATDGQFVAGLIIGVFLGLLLGPILRSWLAWREWVEASKEADLTERFLARWEEDARPNDHPSEGERQAAGHKIPSRLTPPAKPSGGPSNGEGISA